MKSSAAAREIAGRPTRQTQAPPNDTRFNTLRPSPPKTTQGGQGAPARAPARPLTPGTDARMSDVLDQSEVDALLAAVDTGAVNSAPASHGVGGAPQVFSRSGKPASLDVAVYDFKRPERVSKDQMRALEALHEGFGRNFGAALSRYLRTIIEVSVANIEQLTYSEFIHSLPNPTCFNLLKAEQLEGQLCLEISPLIIYPIIDRLLVCSIADLFIPQPPLTQIEQRLVP